MKIISKYLRHLLSLAIMMLAASELTPGAYAQSSNIATGGAATQSSNYMVEGSAFKAIDGNTNGTWGGNSLTHTNNDYQAWWQVDVGFVAQIDQIKLWNRTDCCPDRLSNYYVLVSNEPFSSTNLNTTLSQQGVSGYYFSAAAGSPTTLAVGRTGRYVRVQLAGTNYLTLAEVEIFGGSATTIPSLGFNGEKNNVALAANKTTVAASSTNGNYLAANAINGDRTGKPPNSPVLYWNDGIPNPSTSPDWLAITFDAEVSISKVNVFSVQDAYTNPTEPDRNMSFTKYGLVDFRIEVWLSGAWAAIPDGKGIVTGNTKVWRQITFPAIKTSKIRVVVTKAADQWVRIAEVEAIVNHEGCPGPGLQQEELLSTIQNKFSGDAGTIYWDGYREEAYARWRKCLQPGFAAWNDNGSQNLPVLAAAIGLFREPTLLMTRPLDLARTGTPRYTKWWNDFLGCQVGALETTNRNLGYFKGTEIFSSIYDAPVVTAILAVRYWASFSTNNDKPEASNIDDYARRYLRANWFVYGLSAGTGPAKLMEIPTTPAWNYNQYAFLTGGIASGSPKYSGHFLAMAGSRSNADYMTENQRPALFDRAIEYPVDEGQVSKNQKLLLNHLNTAWKAAWPDATENVYGLTRNDREAFINLITNGTVSYFNLNDWLNGINTSRTVSVLGWNVGGKQVRASILENNPNGNTPAMYGVKYEPETNKVTFLYPWTNDISAGRCHLQGGSVLYSDRVEASQPGVKKKPGCLEEAFPAASATMPIPPTGRIFHLVLSRDRAAYWETTPQSSYPAPLPSSPWEEIPPGNDPDPPQN